MFLSGEDTSIVRVSATARVSAQFCEVTYRQDTSGPNSFHPGAFEFGPCYSNESYTPLEPRQGEPRQPNKAQQGLLGTIRAY